MAKLLENFCRNVLRHETRHVLGKQTKNRETTNHGIGNHKTTNFGITNFRINNFGNTNLGITSLKTTNLETTNFKTTNIGTTNLGTANLGTTNLGSTNLGITNLVNHRLNKSFPIHQRNYGTTNIFSKQTNPKQTKNTPQQEQTRTFAFFRTKKKKEKTALDNYYFVQPETDEFNRVYQLMENHFFPDEPSIKSLEAGYTYNPVFEREVYETLEYGYSYVAKCKWTDCIIGVCLNFSTSEDYPKLLKKYACSVKDENTKQLLLFYAYLQEAPDIFEKYCESQAFVIRAVAVDKDNRNLRVATELVHRSKQLAKDMAFPLVRCDCTSFALARVCEKLGMKWEHDFKYCEYIGWDGKPVFDPAPPNLVVSTYVDLPLRVPRRK